MLAKIKKSLTERGLWKKDEPLLVGVSGGPDSVALLHALVELRKDFGALAVCHLNHQLRGKASDADEEFVRQLAARHDMPVQIHSTDVSRLAKEKKISLEMAARAARLNFFEMAALATGIWKIALAHTADDQAETVLLRLIRGAGREGLAAMEARTRMRSEVVIIRPMLRVTRTEVLGYLKARGLAWQEDKSNRDDTILRNRVRHKLLPFLASEFNQGIHPVLGRTAEILAQEDLLLDSLAAEELKKCAKGKWLLAEKIKKCDMALRRRMVRLWLSSQSPLLELTFDDVEAVLRLAAEPRGSALIVLRNGFAVMREYGSLEVVSISDKRFTHSAAAQEETLTIPGVLEATGWAMQFEAELAPRKSWDTTKRDGVAPRSYVAFFDADSLDKLKLTLRGWHKGDHFQPLGMTDEKKLQDFFVDEKVPKRERTKVPLLVSRDRIVWVVGYRIADWAKVTEKTTRVVKVTAARMP